MSVCIHTSAVRSIYRKEKPEEIEVGALYSVCG